MSDPSQLSPVGVSDLPSSDIPMEAVESSNINTSEPNETMTSNDGQNAPQTLTIRALVSTKEAGVIIGKGGQNVAQLRERSGVKAGVSKVIQGVHDRVLSITGSVEAVALVSQIEDLLVIEESTDVM